MLQLSTRLTMVLVCLAVLVVGIGGPASAGEIAVGGKLTNGLLRQTFRMETSVGNRLVLDADLMLADKAGVVSLADARLRLDQELSPEFGVHAVIARKPEFRVVASPFVGLHGIRDIGVITLRARSGWVFAPFNRLYLDASATWDVSDRLGITAGVEQHFSTALNRTLPYATFSIRW